MFPLIIESTVECSRYNVCRYLPWRAAEVVQVVGLEQVVCVFGVVFLDGSVADKSPEQVAGPVAGGAGQGRPQDEGVLVVAGEGQ